MHVRVVCIMAMEVASLEQVTSMEGFMSSHVRSFVLLVLMVNVLRCFM